jgi:hypothetical protein
LRYWIAPIKEVLLMNSAAQRSFRSVSIALLALAIVACGKSNDKSNDRTPPKAPSPPQETVFDPVISNKARAQEKTERAMETNKEKLDAAMEQIDAPAPAPTP